VRDTRGIYILCVTQEVHIYYIIWYLLLNWQLFVSPANNLLVGTVITIDDVMIWYGPVYFLPFSPLSQTICTGKIAGSDKFSLVYRENFKARKNLNFSFKSASPNFVWQSAIGLQLDRIRMLWGQPVFQIPKSRKPQNRSNPALISDQ